MWTTERQLHFRGYENETEIRSFMQEDLIALHGLTRELPHLMGGRVIVEKGYAIDALSNGRITRTHYDTDVLLATPYNDRPTETFQLIQEILGRATGFDWSTTPQKRSTWVKFHEAGKRQWDDGITGTDADRQLAHQLDLHFVYAPEPFAENDFVEFYPRPGVTYKKPVTSAHLWGLEGREYDLTVPTIEDILATKLRLLRPFEIFYGNTFRESDAHDFALLFNNARLDYGRFVILLEDYYGNQGHTIEDAHLVIRQELQSLNTVVPAHIWDCLSGILSFDPDFA